MIKKFQENLDDERQFEEFEIFGKNKVALGKMRQKNDIGNVGRY